MGRLSAALLMFGVASAWPGAPAAPAAAEPAPRPPAAVGTKLAWRGGGGPRLLWTGFRAKPGGGEVLIQTTSAVELETRPSKDGAVFVLRHCRAWRSTDRLPLDTHFFDSPVTRVTVKETGGDLEVSVALRHPVTAASRKEAGPGGSWFWVLAFPPPSAVAASSSAPSVSTTSATTSARDAASAVASP